MTSIVGNTQAGQTSATAGRIADWKKNTTWAVHLGLSVVFIGTGVLLAQANLDFAWKMLVSIGLIWVGRQLVKQKFTPLIQWSGFIRSAGWITFVTVLLISGFGQLGLAGLNKVEATAAAKATGSAVSCSKERVMVKPGMIFAVPRDCPVYVNQVHMKETGFRFDLVDTDLQKVAVNEEFIAFSQKFRGAESEHDGKLVPQRSMYDLHGRTELFVVISIPKTVRAPL